MDNKNWVQVTELDQETGDLKVIGLAILADGEITFQGGNDIFPESILGLDDQEVTPDAGLAYLAALKSFLTTPYGYASDIESGPLPEIGQTIDPTENDLAA